MEKNIKKASKTPFDTAISYMPQEIYCAVLEYLSRSGVGKGSVNEIRLRAGGPCAMAVGGRNITLGPQLSLDDLREVFKKICGGAVFKYRDDITRGFVTLDGGIRVGVCGCARYENGVVVGVSEISSLVFRIPAGECSFAKELYNAWLSLGGGMLICSGAGEGKTTAIRALAGLIGSGEHARRVVVADERCEFNIDEYKKSHVDILRGYRRALGVEIAVRTMSSEVLIVDEISSREDSLAMLSSLGAGVTVIATAHALSLADAMRRSYIKDLITGGLFNSICIISRRENRFFYSLESIDLNRL